MRGTDIVKAMAMGASAVGLGRLQGLALAAGGKAGVVRALELLEEHPDIAMVLIDIMMPVMDGYEAMRQIRSKVKFMSLPVIALTAKAMKDDKQKCIDAGANDYISKPIDVKRLLSLMRVWLSK